MSAPRIVTGCQEPIFGFKSCSVPMPEPPANARTVTGCSEPIFEVAVTPVQPCPAIYYNAQFTESCPNDPTISFTCPAGKFSSDLSQADADAQAQSYLSALISSKCPGGSPIFDYCGAPQDWPAVPIGIPYSNSGNNFTGMINVFGDSTMSSDGTLLQTTATGFDPLTNLSLTSLPATVSGDFSLSMEVMPLGTNAQRIGFALYDVNTKMAFYPNPSSASSTSVDLELITWCDLIGGGSNVLQSSQPFPGLQAFQWSTITVSRTGAILKMGINSQFYTFNTIQAVNVNLGIMWAQDGVAFSIRNISVTSP